MAKKISEKQMLAYFLKEEKTCLKRLKNLRKEIKRSRKLIKGGKK